jgi:hypothetical protein
MFKLRYVGDGEHYVIGYPTRDIEVGDLDEALRLAETELYEIEDLDEAIRLVLVEVGNIEGGVQDQPTESETN